MKKLLLIFVLLLTVILLTIIGCTKEKLNNKPDCELNNTFTLDFHNFYGADTVYLHIDNNSFLILKDENRKFEVSVNFKNIFIIQRVSIIKFDTVSKMLGHPDCCSIYSYWW